MEKVKTIRKFFAEVLLSSNPTSSKRLVTLLVTLFFLITSFVILFSGLFIIYYFATGKLDATSIELLKLIFNLLDKIVDHDFYIILGGLGFIAIENMGAMMIERAKAKIGNVFSSTTSSYTDTETKEEAKDI